MYEINLFLFGNLFAKNLVTIIGDIEFFVFLSYR